MRPIFCRFTIEIEFRAPVRFRFSEDRNSSGIALDSSSAVVASP